MDKPVQEIEHNYEGLNVVDQRTSGLKEKRFHYCPGCGHGVAHRIVMEALEELGIRGQTIGVAPVGCSVFAYLYMNVDMQQAAHGRATAVATGNVKMKREPSPDSLSTWTSPPIARTRCFTIDRPRPVLPSARDRAASTR